MAGGGDEVQRSAFRFARIACLPESRRCGNSGDEENDSEFHRLFLLRARGRGPISLTLDTRGSSSALPRQRTCTTNGRSVIRFKEISKNSPLASSPQM